MWVRVGVAPEILMGYPCQSLKPHDEPAPDLDIWTSKNYFSAKQFYCVATVCAPCGVIIAWTKFDKSESSIVIGAGNPGVFPAYPYPTRQKPASIMPGMAFAGLG